MTVYFARAVASGQIKIGMVKDDSVDQPSNACNRRRQGGDGDREERHETHQDLRAFRAARPIVAACVPGVEA